MDNRFKRTVRFICIILVSTFIISVLPWREIRADLNTHGEYESDPFSITYDQISTWNNSTQGEITLTNNSDLDVYSWTLEIDYYGDVSFSNIWNAKDITDYETDENIIIEGDVTIPSGSSYSFGFISDGKDEAPISPIDIRVLAFDNGDNQEDIEVPEDSGFPEESSEQILESGEDSEPTVFPYAIFAASTEDDYTFAGWKSNIIGDIYTGKDFIYQGSELYVDGTVRSVGSVFANGWKTEINEKEEGTQVIEIPDWSESIYAKEEQLASVDIQDLYSNDTIIANGYFYSEDSITISGTKFEGDVVIVCKGDITFNVDSLNSNDEVTGRILLYSEEGNITINGSKIELNGVLYAPKGRVSINAYDTTLNGRIIADKFSYNGSVLNVYSDPSEMQLVTELPDVKVTALQDEVYLGEVASFRIDVPKDNAYEILYRLNGETVIVEEPENKDAPLIFSFVPDQEGEYVFEAYVDLPNGEVVLDSASVEIVLKPTATPTEEPTVTDVPTDDPTPTLIPTVTSEPTNTVTPDPTVTAVPTSTSTPIPTITEEPTETPVPTEVPFEDQEKYAIYSQGDLNYNYKELYDLALWETNYCCSVFPECITVMNNDIMAIGEVDSLFYREVSPDYSFSVRFTYCCPSAVGNAVLFRMKNGAGTSLDIQIDLSRSEGGHSWRDPYGQGEWQYDEYEPFNSMISIDLNNDGMKDYCIAEYLPFLVKNSDHDVWMEYDGETETLYVYVATYDETGTVTKPAKPTLVLNISLNELFEGDHDLYISMYSHTGLFADGTTYYYRGIEFDPYPDIHAKHSDSVEILGTFDNETHEVDDEIPVIGRVNPDIDVKSSVISVIDENGDKVFSKPIEITTKYDEIANIVTTGFEPGIYTIEVAVKDKDDNEYTKTATLTLNPETIHLELSKARKENGTINIYGTVDFTETGSYELRYYDYSSDEWKTIVTDGDETINGVLGSLEEEKNPYSNIFVDLIAVSESGSRKSLAKRFTIEIPIPTDVPTTTPTAIPTQNPEFTDEELFVDIDDIQDGNEVSFITDIKGTVSGSKLQSYKFEVFPVGSEEAVYTSTGTSEVNEGTVGTIDPTLLMNGYYKVVLTAYAEEGSIEDSIVVLVTGQAKIGNYSISFLDMTLPVSGLPVEVYRTYDSRQRTEEGDFGYGWTMSIGGPKISYSGDLAYGWDYEDQTTLLVPLKVWKETYPHEINIDWGNGKTETFKMVLSPEKWIDVPAGQVSVSFTNSDGTSDTLELLGMSEGLSYDIETKSLFDGGFNTFNPKNYLLTRYDGMKFYFNIDSGLYKVEDTYGRTIEITEDGIVYSEGGSISFNRDSEGRITSITDGLGNEVTYSYDENGDLVSVNDTAGYNTTFGYDDSHFLTDITADNGKKIARNEYDEDGRLIATIDADGHRIEFEHDLENKREVTTDRLGYVTVYYYDDNGNVLSVTDANGHTTKYTYDENNNKISETRPDDTTFSFTYDENGNLLTSSDDHGRTVSSTYGSYGELLTMSAMGVTELTMVYDERGNLITSTDSAGNTQNYGYDSKGDLTSVTDNLGTLMSMTYDENGHVVSITNGEGQVTNFTYDEGGRLTTRSVTYQGTTLTDTYSYDAANRVTKITFANGNTVSYTYNQAGDVTSSTDSQGRTVSYTYDIYGNLLKIGYPDGTSETFTYDLEGNNLTATDRMGRTASFEYDPVGNCISKTYANGATEEFTYDSCDRLITSTNVYGGVTTYGYDYIGRNTSVTDANGNTTTYTYTDRGNVASLTDAEGNTYLFTYDNNGNQTSVKYPNGSTYTTTYDVRSRMTSQSDAYGNTTYYSYDEMDRLESVTDALGNMWSYTYDSMGNIKTVTDSMGYVTTYSYDLNGQITSVKNAKGNEATTSYDKYGRVVSTTDFAGTKTTYTYDSMDRVVTTTTNGEVTTYSYDDVGNLVSVKDPTGTISYGYNEDGYLSSVKNAKGEVITYEYNEGGQVSKVSIDGKDISYGYDNMGRLVSVTDSEGTTAYAYDKIGNRISTAYPNGVVTTYEYNETNVLVKQVTKNSNGEILQSFEYTIGDNGERLKVTELYRTVEYSYDELERLVSEKVTANGTVSLTTYAYDSNSNRISMDKDGVVTTYEYNELNQLVKAGDITYTWDNAGNLVSQSQNGTLVATYTYDSHNRMVTASVNNGVETIEESYTYDYLGNRTSKISNGVKTEYTTDLTTGYSQVLKAKTGTESIYYTRGFELISKNEGTEASYYVYDGGMSVRALIDEAGDISDTFVFDAFGNETERAGTTDNSYGFQGEEKDATGLYYLRARYMDPSTGTFTSMDTYGGRLSDPMSLHKYLFANSNPVKYCDPSGHYTKEEAACVLGIMGALMSAATYYTLGEYFHWDKDANYFAGLVLVTSMGAIVGAAIGYNIFAISAWFVVNALQGCIILLLLGALIFGIGQMAYSTGNDLIGDIFVSIGITAFEYGAIGLISYAKENLSQNANKRGGGYINGSSDSTTKKKTGPKPKGTGPHNEKIEWTSSQVSDGEVVAGGGRGFPPEAQIETPDGSKSYRRPDILVKKTDGSYYGINVGKTTATGAPIKREAEAINDLEGAGLPMWFVSYDRGEG